MNIETIISGKQKVTENKKKLSEKQKKKRIKLSNFNQTSFNAHQATWLLVHLSQQDDDLVKFFHRNQF